MPHARPTAVRPILALLATLLLGHAAPASAQIELTDDAGQRIVLAQPAQRIVSLAPHVTEILFAAGAGEHVVGVVAYHDSLPAARAPAPRGRCRSPRAQGPRGGAGSARPPRPRRSRRPTR